MPDSLSPSLPTTVPQPLLVKRYVFSDASIQNAIDKAVANLPADKKGALVGYGERKPDGSYDVALAAKLGDQWSIAIGAAMTTTKDLTVEGAVVFSW